MKTRTWILIFTVVLLGSLALSIPLLLPGEKAAYAEIVSDGQVLHILDLNINQELRIDSPTGGHNVVTVKDGAIAVTEATCPDHYCMHRGYCSSGAQIVCLPNRLVIRFLGEQSVDIAVG